MKLTVRSGFIGMLAVMLAAGLAGCGEDVEGPGSGPNVTTDTGGGLTPEESSDLAAAERSGKVTQGGQVLTGSESEALAKGSAGAMDGEVLLAAGGTAPYNLELRTHSGNFGTVNIWYYYPAFGGWVSRVCVTLPKRETWLNTHLSVPANVDVFFDGFLKANKTCGQSGKPDLQVKLHSPTASAWKNWWVDVF